MLDTVWIKSKSLIYSAVYRLKSHGDVYKL